MTPISDPPAPEAEVSEKDLLGGEFPALACRATASSQPDADGANPETAQRQGVLTAEAIRALMARTVLPPPRRKLLEGLAMLWHDHWEAAHIIAQSHEGQADHDLLHAMVHRREGDFANSGYWFRAAGKHPAFALLERGALDLLPAGDPRRDILLPGGHWSPKDFVVEVRLATGKARGRELPDAGENRAVGDLVRLQALEFKAFAHWLLSA